MLGWLTVRFADMIPNWGASIAGGKVLAGRRPMIKDLVWCKKGLRPVLARHVIQLLRWSESFLSQPDKILIQKSNKLSKSELHEKPTGSCLTEYTSCCFNLETAASIIVWPITVLNKGNHRYRYTKDLRGLCNALSWFSDLKYILWKSY